MGLPPQFRIEWVQLVRQTVDTLDAQGVGTLPEIPVELEPADLARGVDTVLEAAITALR